MDNRALRTVADVMTAAPIRFQPDERVELAWAMMVACRFRHLPIVEEPRGGASGGSARPIGMLTLGDLLRRQGRTVREVMRTPLFTVAPDVGIFTAAWTLERERVSSLVVLDNGRLAGIVTCSDFLGAARQLLAEERLAHGGLPTVERLMTPRPLLTIAPEQPISHARHLLRTARLSHLPVVRGEELVGILSDHDVIGAPADARVEQLMGPRLVTVRPDDAAADAARLLERRKIGALPVAVNGQLVGMLSPSDYFYYVLSWAPAEAQVSA